MLCRLCRHCHRAPRARPRGLCWSCYHDRRIRVLYPVGQVWQSVGDGYGSVPRPPEPTAALPGTAAKIAILAQRARRRWQLWHPDDARIPD